MFRRGLRSVIDAGGGSGNTGLTGGLLASSFPSSFGCTRQRTLAAGIDCIDLLVYVVRYSGNWDRHLNQFIEDHPLIAPTEAIDATITSSAAGILPRRSH
jgi:hypothetical protein